MQRGKKTSILSKSDEVNFSAVVDHVELMSDDIHSRSGVRLH